jgi:alkanesulfonate monooxygenase SsuD/methylene tetrahydromethanopterin reductase-like flavin-dependent oxidoreductase (luciferase family)
VRFAIYLPTVNEFADVRLLADLARAAEESGWDGVFVWDVLSLSLDGKPWPQVDAWAARAAKTLEAGT